MGLEMGMGMGYPLSVWFGGGQAGGRIANWRRPRAWFIMARPREVRNGGKAERGMMD